MAQDRFKSKGSWRSLRKNYKEILATVPKLKGKYVLDEIPDDRLYKSMLRKRAIAYARQKYQHSIWDLDRQVFIHKYYPWSYQEYVPTLVPQGWYRLKQAKAVYRKVFGPHALDHVKFIKGKLALERDFKVGISLYINKHWQYIPSKTGLLALSKFGSKEEITSFLEGTTVHDVRSNLDMELIYYNNGSGGSINYQARDIAKARLQKRKSLAAKAKRDLYDIPDEYKH